MNETIMNIQVASYRIKNTKQRLSKFVLLTNKQNRCFAKTKLYQFFV